METQTTFDIAGPGITEGRPKVDDDVRKLIAERLVDPVLQWFKSKGSDEDRDEITEELIYVLKESVSLDGFELVHEYKEHTYCDADENLVDVFSCAHSIQDSVLSKLTKEWIERNKITPKYAVGDKVKFENYKNGEIMIGEITKHYLDSARYLIFCEELGHIRKGVNSSTGIGVHGTLIAYEIIEALNAKMNKI